jgi:hypothetical protein
MILPDVWQDHIGRYMEAHRMRDKPIAFMQWHLRVMRVENIEKALEHDREVFQRLYDKALPCDQKYTELIDRTIEGLERRCAELAEIEAADRRAARALAAVDTSDKGRLRHRYRLENQREIYKALDQIEKLNAITRKHGRPEAVEEREAEEECEGEPKATNRNGDAIAAAAARAVETAEKGATGMSSVGSTPVSRNEPKTGPASRHESHRLRTDPTPPESWGEPLERLDRPDRA